MAHHRRDLTVVLLALSLFGKRGTEATTPDNVSSELQIHVPHSLHKEGGYEHREALFGIPPYGGSVAQNVYYADSDLCDSNVDTRKGFPIREKDESGHMMPWPSPYILMIDRGGCTFVRKVRNAQRSGAAAVIVADNVCLCSDSDCVSSNDSTDTCETAEPVMADDGSGSDISIPCFLMFKMDADAVKQELRANHMVQMEMSFALPAPDDRVEYDLWTVPTDPVSRDFLKNFKEISIALGDHAYFTPHMYIYDGTKSGCQGADGENQCYNLCTNNGRYCATDPDNDLDRGISGAEVVEESLRRICVWKSYGETDGIGEEWWDYIAEFTYRCDNPDFFSNKDCIADAYKHAKVDANSINQCIMDSGGLDADEPNSLLDMEIAAQTRRGVVVIPTAFVNTAALRGALTVSNVFSAVCAGYTAGSKPEICTMCSSCADVSLCAKSGKCGKQQDPQNPDNNNSAAKNDDEDMVNMVADMIADELGQCGIDVEAITSSIGGLGQNSEGGTRLLRPLYDDRALEGIETLLLDEKDCSKEEETQFTNALDAFNTCTGWNLKEAIESFPSALFGTAIKCARDALSAGQDFMEAADIDMQTITENIGECTDHIFGNNPLGQIIHDFYRYPHRNCPCFAALNDSIPKCMMDIWPVPMFGGMIKTTSCLVGLGCDRIDDACLGMIQSLDECLPGFDADEDVPCDEIRDQCPLLSISALPQFEGLPLPDACERVYHADQDISHTKVLERMDKFRTKCSAEGEFWNGYDFTPSVNEEAESSLRGSGATMFLCGTLLGFILGVFSLVLSRRGNSSSAGANGRWAFGKTRAYEVVAPNAQMT